MKSETNRQARKHGLYQKESPGIYAGAGQSRLLGQVRVTVTREQVKARPAAWTSPLVHP
jgi:hypothetical protein